MSKTFGEVVDVYLADPEDDKNFYRMDAAFERAIISGLLKRPELLKLLTPREEASVVLLLYGMERWEIAKVMGVKPESVKALWIRARHSLERNGVKGLFMYQDW